jgi:hypothetical protein
LGRTLDCARAAGGSCLSICDRQPRILSRKEKQLPMKQRFPTKTANSTWEPAKGILCGVRWTAIEARHREGAWYRRMLRVATCAAGRHRFVLVTDLYQDPL